MSELQSVNAADRLYMSPLGCIGFDVADGRAREYAQMLGRDELIPTAAKGTAEHYWQYAAAQRAWIESPQAMRETVFDHGTPEAVRRILESARYSSQRLRLFYGDAETGVAWPEEHNVIGTIGRSMGPVMVPVLIASARSIGGAAIMTGCIVAVKLSPSAFLYRHPTFTVGEWTEGPVTAAGYVTAVYHDGKLHAQFEKSESAMRYIAFMKGERFAK